MNLETEDLPPLRNDVYHPGFSIDCVVFGFHDHQLKVLLLKRKSADHWALPGGFVYKDENVEDAATRLLLARTGLTNIFLRQFHLFGDVARNNEQSNRQMLESLQPTPSPDHWFLQRFISLGYYALIDFSIANPRPDSRSEACAWWDLQQVSHLHLDHRQILDKALATLRQQLNREPIGYNLLPEKFTIPELQVLYETILGKKLDRRNFQKRVLSYGILTDLQEKRKGGAHKPPSLYSFDLGKYEQALTQGFQNW